MAVASFGTLNAPNSSPITTDLEGWKPIEGKPTMKTWIEYAGEDGKFLAGYWEATEGTYQVTYNVDEMVHLFEGKVTLTSSYGESTTYVGGDSFVVSAGTTITWTTITTVRKIFAIKVPQGVTALFS